MSTHLYYKINTSAPIPLSPFCHYICTMKRTGWLQIRIEETEKQRFADACEVAGIKQSDVIRHLLQEVIAYVDKHQKSWDSPRLVGQDELATDRMKAKIFTDLADPDSPIANAMQVLIDRALSNRGVSKIAAESRPTYGAGAGTHTQVITPPAVRMPARTVANAVKVERKRT